MTTPRTLEEYMQHWKMLDTLQQQIADVIRQSSVPRWIIPPPTLETPKVDEGL